jgi:hypothetical protein
VSRDEIAAFVKARDEALLSMDLPRINAYLAAYGSNLILKDDEIGWMAVHKARTGATSLPQSERETSVKWLSERGYRSFA